MFTMMRLAILTLVLVQHCISSHELSQLGETSIHIHPNDNSGILSLDNPAANNPNSTGTTLASGIPREVVLMAGGSLSTIVKVYQYTPDNTHPLGFSNMVLHRSSAPVKIGHCVGQLFHNCSTLTYLITFARNYTTQTPETVEMYMLGDGGTRGLGSQEFVNKLTTALNNATINPFKFNVSRIISGEEEAAFSWVALNYLQGFFDSEPLTKDTMTMTMTTGTTDVRRSSGVVDVSLESAQVAFQCTPQAGSFPVTLGNTVYTLYTHSYMGLGEHGLARLMAEADAGAILQGGGNSTVTNEDGTTSELPTWDNPCFLKGDNKVLTHKEGRLMDPKDHTNQNEQRIMHVGTGEPDKCLNFTMEQLKVTPDDCHMEPCAIGNVYQPTLMPDMPLYTINHIAETMEDFVRLGKISSGQPVDMSIEWETAYYMYCVMTKEQAVKMGVAPEVASSRCLMGMYGPELLYRLGVPNQDANIYVATHINHQPVEWELGAMVMATHEGIARGRREACHTDAHHTHTDMEVTV